MRLLAALEWVVGRRAIRPGVEVQHDGRQAREEIVDLAELTRRTFREPVKFEPPGKPNRMLLTDDLKDGRLPADYLERRAARRAEAESRPASFGSFDGNVDPE